METPLISIVIPVYNVESFLRKCLESVFHQSYTNWECILVDDGSLDGSGHICDEFATLDSRFRAIHIPNGGVSAARNLGIENAKGEFITFIDSDDFVEPDFLQAYMDCSPQPDSLTIVGIKTITPTREFVSYAYDDIYGIKVEDAAPTIVKYDLFEDGGPTNKLFDLYLLRKKGLRFNTSLSFHEDHLFVYNYYLQCSSINLSSFIGYYYMFYGEASADSLSRSGKKNIDKLIEASEEFSKVIPKVINRYGINDKKYINIVNTRNGYSQILLATLNLYKNTSYNDSDRKFRLSGIRANVKLFRSKYSPLTAKRFAIITILSLPLPLSHRLMNIVSKWI